MAAQQSNAVGWFEIPVMDMERAVKFYEAVLGHKLERHKMHEVDMAWFPMNMDIPGATGSLVCNPEFYQPSEKNGTLIYFTAFSGDVNNELKKVTENGGKVLVPKTKIGEDYGYMAVILDSEGNRIALHSQQ